MPFAVPSHMGLAAPLWRRWPNAFDISAVCIGSVMPDVVDGLVGATQGHLGQGIGHSFIGLVLLCVPGGLPLWFAVAAWARRSRPSAGEGFWARCWNAARDTVLAAPATHAFKRHVRVVLVSLAVGTFCHLVTDVISHAECPWLYPWIQKPAVFPDWWKHVWFRMPIPGYGHGTGYPFAPHFVSWLFLSGLGAWWLLKPILRSESAEEFIPAGSFVLKPIPIAEVNDAELRIRRARDARNDFE